MNPPDRAGAGDYLRSLPLYALPHHLLSRLMLAATRVRTPLIKNALIRWFVGRYRVDMDDAVVNDPLDYPDFNAFFTRALRPDRRPLPATPEAVISPVDGAVSQLGDIRDGRLFQAKGRDFSLVELLGGDAARAAPFMGGSFATLYLSPRDYHRIHMPFPGRLLETTYVPGRLFSVAPHTTRTIPNLFARNERIAALFDTAAGPMAVVLVGAIFVACIETVWAGVVTPPRGRRVVVHDYRTEERPAVQLDRGDELGRFNMGSTVILLFGPQRVRWQDSLGPGSTLCIGQQIAALETAGP
ncbi:MAG TPA: archaetidylserine decarboxylase [Gammaproteobacteria bacterium]|nr:archaetidylserine decarboxylase [Gammaproteobacteria bacterium]